ncbi:MAG: DbpA RNA binding domain-containing protein [Treponema sp.]|nr:DbpA RNA binding domain-containing protein [Treponema sp.]
MYNTNNNTFSEEQISALLKEALERVEDASEADVQLFDTIKKLYKQNVPFSRRKYVAAYLVRQAVASSSRPSRTGRDRDRDRERKDFSRGEGRYSSDRFEGRRSERPSRYDRESRQERPSAERSERPQRSERPERAPRVQIDPAVADTVFISIGRNRRVYPRDLVGLLVSVAGLDRERIGDIRVLANYSFVQLFKEDCDKVISSLNDYDYRGRKLSVSYSKKGDAEGFSSDAGDSSSEPSGDRPVAASSYSEPERQAPISETSYDDEKIPANVSNASYGVSETSESARISEEQSAFAARQSSGDSSGSADQYSTTTEDGQVTSHFGTGAAY